MRWSVFIPSSLFSLFMVLGSSFHCAGDWSLVFGSYKRLALSLILFIGYFVLFYIGIPCIFRFLDSSLLHRWSATQNKTLRFIFNKHPLAAPWLIILICWLPFLIAFFPGCVSWDMFGQLKQYFGIWELTSHQPPLSTLLAGLCLQTGRSLGSENLGIFFYTALQTIAFSFSLSFSIFYMGKIKAPYWLRIFALAFFALCPLFPGYAQWVVKDTIFTAAMIFYLIFLIELVRRPENILYRPLRLICFILIILLVSMFRNNGIYIIFLSAPFLLFTLKTKKNRRIVLSVLLGTLILLTCYSKILLPAVGVSKGSIAEALSIPLQQTARYVKIHGDEVTPEEKEAIDKILDYDRLAELYNPEISDPVKATFRKDASTEDIKAYFTVWFQGLCKHPETYIQATMHNVYGYFYPNVCIWEYNGRGFSTTTAPDEQGDFHFHTLEAFGKVRSLLEKWSIAWNKIPVIGTFYRLGNYTWLIILLACYLFSRKKYRETILLLPYLLLILVCIASPVNRYVRYFLPIISSLPVVFAALLFMLRTKKADNKNHSEISDKTAE